MRHDAHGPDDHEDRDLDDNAALSMAPQETSDRDHSGSNPEAAAESDDDTGVNDHDVHSSPSSSSPRTTPVARRGSAAPTPMPPTPVGSLTASAIAMPADPALAVRVEVDGLGVKGYLSMRDEGVTYHRMKRYFCRCVGVNFYRFSSRETASTMIHAVFGAEIARVEPWDGRGLLHTYRYGFQLHFTNGIVFNADADTDEDRRAWIEYLDRAIRGATMAMEHWRLADPLNGAKVDLTPGGLAFVETRHTGPKFENKPRCKHPTCTARFESAGKRQHHCRNCGGSVCSDHSYRFAILRHFQMNTAVRLCTSCYRVQRFLTWLSMIVQRLSMTLAEPVRRRTTTTEEEEEIDAVSVLLSDGLFGISDVIQVLHLHRHGADEAYMLAVNKLLELAARNVTDFEFFLPQIFQLWLTMDWTTNDMKSAMLFRVICFAAQLHVRFATSIYWLARASVDDSCGWGFGQSEHYIPEYLYRKLSMCKLLMINSEMQIYQKDWTFEPDQDIPASTLQTNMIRCLFNRLEILVSKIHSQAAMRMGGVCEAVSTLALPAGFVEETAGHLREGVSENVMEENRHIFQSQITFIQQLCDMTERLRKVQPDQRKMMLKKELANVELPDNAFCPLGSCEDALLRFLAIARDEGTVFTTKARAPTLIFFEVESMSTFASDNQWLQSTPTCSESTLDESEDDKALLQLSTYPHNIENGMGDGDVSVQSRRSKNAIELATSSEIAQALPLNALEETSSDRSSGVVNTSKGVAFPDTESSLSLVGDDDEECDEHVLETRDRVASDLSRSFRGSTKEGTGNSRRRSGSLVSVSSKTLDTLFNACAENLPGRRKRSVSEGNENEFESSSRSTMLRHEFEKFTSDQLMSIAIGFERSLQEGKASQIDTFTGKDIIDWMKKNEIVADDNHARWLGEEMMQSGVIEATKMSESHSEDFVTNSTYRISRSAIVRCTGDDEREQGALGGRGLTRSPVGGKGFPDPPLRYRITSGTLKHSPSSGSAARSRLISPRKTTECAAFEIASVVGASFPSSPPRATSDGSRSSQFRASGPLGIMDEQRSVNSSSTAVSLLERINPDTAISALSSIENVLEQQVFSQLAAPDSEQIRSDIRVLEEQLDLVAEYIRERKQRRHIAVESAFGESFEEKKERLRKSSRYLRVHHSDGWDCVAFIVKSNDDLRQEVLCLQLIRQLQDIFQAADLPLRLLPYRIIATSGSTGMIEYIKNATSLDGLKKRPGYTNLAHHFSKTYGEPDTETYKNAMANYVRSMAAYSLACYLLQIKDRHNGNIMIDSEGHVVHIDFGFIMGIAPGGRFSLETAPFKLTSEMVEAMGGTQSENFKAYVILLIQGFLALQQHADTILLMIAIMAQESSCPCFLSQNPRDVLNTTKELLKLQFNQHQVIKHVLRLVRRSHNSYRTRQYDVFQKLTNGIAP